MKMSTTWHLPITSWNTVFETQHTFYYDFIRLNLGGGVHDFGRGGHGMYMDMEFLANEAEIY